MINEHDAENALSKYGYELRIVRRYRSDSKGPNWDGFIVLDKRKTPKPENYVRYFPKLEDVSKWIADNLPSSIVSESL